MRRTSTRNYRWWTAFGVRGSMIDDGLSFGTNHNAGVCIHFAQKTGNPRPADDQASPAQNVPFGHRHPAELPHPITAPDGGYVSGE